MAEQDLINLIENGFKLLGARIEETRAEMREEFAKVNARLDGVEHRLDGVEQRLDRVEDRLGSVEHRLDGVEHRLTRVETEIEHIRGKIDFVIEGILNLDQKLDRHVAENNRQFDEIEDHFDLVHSAVRHSHVFGERLDVRVTSLESLRH